MKKTNRIILISIMFTLLLLGIGYAAIQNITLTISGFAKIDANQGNFNVKFVEPIEVNNNGYNDVIVNVNKNSDISSEINLKGLSEAGETISVVYPIANESRDLSADLKIKTTNDAPEYITIKSQLAKTSLVPGDETTVEVTIEVTKTPITDNIKAKIGVELIAMPVQPGEEGTSEGINDFDQTPYPNGKNEFGYYYDRFYCNEELGWGIISHADYSAELFELWKAEEHEGLTEDEWFCTSYWGPGGNNPEEGLLNGGRIENEGKTIVNPDGTVLTLSDIKPHGIYLGKEYLLENEDGKVNKFIYLENNFIRYASYDSDGLILEEGNIDNFLIPEGNGYIFKLLGQDISYFNVTGELMYIVDGGALLKIDKTHNYISKTIIEPTCTQEGQMKCICSDCNKFFISNLNPHNHKNDKDFNEICDDCGKILEYETLSYNIVAWAILMGNSQNIDKVDAIIPPYIYSTNVKSWYKIIGIYKEAFYNDLNLKTIVIPDTAMKIEKNAFYGCENLKIVNYTGTKEQWEQIVIEEGNDILNNVTINFNYVIPTE